MSDPVFLPVLFTMIRGDGVIDNNLGYAFETPGWPNFHAVAHETPRGWTATHWESGMSCLDTERLQTREEVPARLTRKLNAMPFEFVQRAVAPWGIKLP